MSYILSVHTPADEQSAASSQANSQHLEIAELVAMQARSAPGAIAVAHNTDVLTYGDLDARANVLAHRLRSLGVGPDTVVGLCFRRSPAMIVGALGILKSGGAYLPLDPAHPTARLAFQLRDSQTSVLLTGQCMTERLPAGNWEVFYLDPDGQQSGAGAPAEAFEPPAVDVKPENLAYVIYTSGSTGQPKGVEITRRSLLNLVSWHQQAFAVTPADRATQLASPGFDAAVWEVWPYLTAGASVHLPDEDVRSQAEKLRDWLQEQAVSITFVPTPMAERLIDLEWPVNGALRVLLTGADTLHHYPPANLRFQLVNNYGPTECTVVATSGPVLADRHPSSLPPIGRPIANTQVFILDENMQEVPLGAHGELYIGGLGLARGYRNRPHLTREKFVCNPFSTDPGARLYRTGDLARRLPDGQIAFLGRIDEQVKIRGQRIEPHEIVTVLDTHPMVRASFVTAREDEPGDKRLVAYVIPKPGSDLSDKVLRDFLGKQIPDFMVPAVFVALESLPLNASGKVDRNRLPAPGEANVLKDEVYVAPRTSIEERMAGMLAALLRFEKVGLNDNFFLLGGNSLLGAQVIARVRDTFGVELSLLGLFDHPTVADLSSEIERLLVAKLNAMSEQEAERLAVGFVPRSPISAHDGSREQS
jgi:amino acid adenylation domain-containing protein